MKSDSQTAIAHHLKQINLPRPNSHKGQNGKVLVIGGSKLFHAASKWSLDIAAKFVDMVFYSSVPSNNQLVQEAKANFWNGIVIPREEIENYLAEADCILIGPGMERQSSQNKLLLELLPLKTLQKKYIQAAPSTGEWNQQTEVVTNYLLAKYPQKKWVVDAGALQMVDPRLLNQHHIITPHQKELAILTAKLEEVETSPWKFPPKKSPHTAPTILIKGMVDRILSGKEDIEIAGGNPGMTKGGTGDVLAGLVAALYCQHPALTAVVVSSYINKKAGEVLYQQVGPYYNSSDLLEIIPQVMWSELAL